MTGADRQRLFSEVVHAHQRSVRRICRSFLFDRNATDDLCQEVWLNVWRHLDRFEGRSSWVTYLYRITVNTVVSHNRRGRSTVPLDQAPEAIDEAADSQARESAEARRSADLHRAIHRLAPVDRIIIALVLEDLSYQQISDITGLVPGHVGVRISRAKEKLRSLLHHEQQS